MRTTLTLDDDVAIRLERLRKKRDASLKDVVNDALRQGLQALETRTERTPFVTKVYSMGEALISIDNVAEAIAYAEGEDFK